MKEKMKALGLITGIDEEWYSYLSDLIEESDRYGINLDLDIHRPDSVFPSQLKNPSVIKTLGDGSLEHLSTQVWIAINSIGKKELIEPEETSGVLLSQDGRLLKHFNGLPTVTPKDTIQLLRIRIQPKEMHVRLYGKTLNQGLYS